MKKTVTLILALVLVVALLAGCGAKQSAATKIRVAASPTPHAEILGVAKELLAKEDVTFVHDLALAAEKAMEADAEKALRVFAGL